MKRIKLVYWHTNIDNYGDLLSPYVIGKLSGCEIIQKNYYVGNFKSHLYNTVVSILHSGFRFNCRYQFPFESVVMGIGSILHTGNKKARIWGAGFMDGTTKCNGGVVYALRGNLSFNRIREQIADGDYIKVNDGVALGDPALLLPLLIAPSHSKRYNIGIVPHFSEYQYFKNRYGERYHVIDLRSSDIKRVTEDITSCEKILSTSLHGLIVAHAYRIPALWMEYTGLEKGTCGFKFNDYFSGVGINGYLPIKDIEAVLSSRENVIRRFEEMERQAVIQNDLATIQRNLIKAAPFCVSDRFV